MTVNELPLLTDSHSVDVCANAFPYEWTAYGITFAGPETVINTVSGATGCDTIVTLTVNELPLLTASHSRDVCANDFPYEWTAYGITFAGPETVIDTVSGATGCDTIVTLTVNELPLLTDSHSVDVCANAFPYTWTEYNHTFTTFGSWTDTVAGPGCDTIVTLTVNELPLLTDSHSVDVCANAFPYEWTAYGKTGRASGRVRVCEYG